jgi:hypothetical protein
MNCGLYPPRASLFDNLNFISPLYKIEFDTNLKNFLHVSCIKNVPETAPDITPQCFIGIIDA